MIWTSNAMTMATATEIENGIAEGKETTISAQKYFHPQEGSSQEMRISGMSCAHMPCFDSGREWDFSHSRGYDINGTGCGGGRQELLGDRDMDRNRNRNNPERGGGGGKVVPYNSNGNEIGFDKRGIEFEEDRDWVHDEKKKEMEMMNGDLIRTGKRKEIINLEWDPNTETVHGEGSHGCQELTLSYMCERRKAEAEALGGAWKQDKGKQLALSLSNGTEPVDRSDRWLERDFLHLKSDKERGASSSKQEEEEEEEDEKHRQKKAKTEDLQLCLGLTLASASPNLSMTRSIQSWTSSDGFTQSLDYSHSHTFAHNPSCSLTQNSMENYECSVSGHPISQGIDSNWQVQAPYESEQFSYGNNGSMGLTQERFRTGKDISLYQRALQNGCSQGGNSKNRKPVKYDKGGGNTRSQGSYQMAKSMDGSQDKSESNERQFSFPRELPQRCGPSRSVSSQETKYRQQMQNDKSMSKPKEDIDILPQRNKHVWDGEQATGRDFITANRILHEIVLEPINIMAQKLQELPDEIIDDVREYLRYLILSDEKGEQLANFQKSLKRRCDLMAEMLVKSHRCQLEILLTLKTGLEVFLHCNHIPTSQLVEIFLDLRCRNLDCKNQLPVDDCECKICSERSGFCSMCMCLICAKFDCASNTCSWVGCDICLHWCHTDCGIRMSYIKPGPSIKGASGTTEMQFHCIACDHSSEMFGFVKEVFKTCAKGWGVETLKKELDCVKRIFQGSEDPRGKQLQSKAEEMLGKLDNKSCGPSEVCSSLFLFFTECESGFSGTANGVAKEPVQPKESEEICDQFAIAVREAIYKINPSSSKIFGNRALDICQASDRDHAGKKAEATDLLYKRVKNKPEIDELESIVRIKQAEAQMFQSRADDARREAQGLKRIALAKNDKIEEEYAGKLAKLCLTVTEDRRRQKLHELQILETAHRNYCNMKIRMETDIKELLIKLETTRGHFI